MAYVVAISAFFAVAAFGMFIKYDCGNGAQLEAMASEADMPAWGPQDERGIDMEVETAAADLAAGSDAVILRHPESVKTISKLIKALA